MNTSNSERVYEERIHLAVDYISEHLSEEISLEKLAAVACFSPFHFHRIFSAITGETPREFIERVKLEEAANLLCTMKNKTVEDIAYYCGFKSVSTFSRSFKKYHGVPPVKFLKKHIDDFHSLNVVSELRLKSFNQADISLVSIKKIPAYNVIYAQSLESYRSGIPKAWIKVVTYARVNDLWLEPACLIGIPYNNPGITPYEKCRYRACIPVDDGIDISKGEIKTQRIESATCAVYHFKGKREDITNAYAFLYGFWLKQSGYIPDEKPIMEIYPLEIVTNLPDVSYIHREVLEYDIALPIVPL